MQSLSLTKSKLSAPWPDEATARALLGALLAPSGAPLPALPDAAWPAAARWLIDHGLGPLAYARCRAACPALTPLLQADAFSATAENSIHAQNLADIKGAFAAAGIPIALLKGAALAETAYGGLSLRTMSDVDIWVQAADLPAACQVMSALGFRYAENRERPWALQALAGGELCFYRPAWPQGLVELHLSPFPGWWLRRTAAVDEAGLWARRAPLPGAPGVYQLAAEDALLHVAVHTAVNHQFGLAGVRSLMDMAFIVQTRRVDWGQAAARARAWRVGTAFWQALSLYARLFEAEGVQAARAALRPSPWRRLLLRRFVSLPSLLAGRDLRSGPARLLLLLLLVDRPRDMLRLAFRTAWPEPAWLMARYGSAVSPWRHWRYLLRRRRI
jgi:hypothetical protein